ncbi:MAG: response regulator [Candidatus Nomurabacteria bacterium]|nr:MAG: response regulator [Candidatus Nomurabacteria bacterium]
MTNSTKALLGKKILVIGGDYNFLNTIERMFIYAGAEAIIENSLSKGLSSMKTLKPDLILLDASVPDLDPKSGDILKAIYDNNEHNLPLILITSDSDSANTPKYEVDYVVQKLGIDLLDLIEKIKKTLLVSTENSDTVIDISEHDQTPVLTKDAKAARVLVVEDDPLLRSLLSVRLTKSKISYQFCHNGNNVIDIMKHYHPTIIILDLMLPGRNGLDVLQDIRKIDGFKAIPVVIFSNKDSDSDRALAQKLGVKHFLIKAMTDLNSLLKIIIESAPKTVDK